MELFFNINEKSVEDKLQKMFFANVSIKDEFIRWVMCYDLNKTKTD